MKKTASALVVALLSVSGAVLAQSGATPAPAMPNAPAQNAPQPGPHGHAHGHGHGAGHHHAYGHHHGHGQAQGGERMMRHLDTDRDGAISRAEVEAAHQRHLQMFDHADADRDGKLTRTEMQAARRAMQEQFQQRTPGAPARPATPAPQG